MSIERSLNKIKNKQMCKDKNHFLNRWVLGKPCETCDLHIKQKKLNMFMNKKSYEKLKRKTMCQVCKQEPCICRELHDRQLEKLAESDE